MPAATLKKPYFNKCSHFDFVGRKVLQGPCHGNLLNGLGPQKSNKFSFSQRELVAMLNLPTPPTTVPPLLRLLHTTTGVLFASCVRIGGPCVNISTCFYNFLKCS